MTSTTDSTALQDNFAAAAARPNLSSAFSGLKHWSRGQSPETAAALAYSRRGRDDLGPELLTWRIGGEDCDENRIAAWLEAVTRAWASNAHVRFRQPSKMADAVKVAARHAMFDLRHAFAVEHKQLGVPTQDVAKQLGVRKETYCDLKGAAISALRTAINQALRHFYAAFGVFELEDIMSEAAATEIDVDTRTTEEKWNEGLHEVLSWVRDLLGNISAALMNRAIKKIHAEYKAAGIEADLVSGVGGGGFPKYTLAAGGLGLFVAYRQTDSVVEESIESMALAGWLLAAPMLYLCKVSSPNDNAYLQLSISAGGAATTAVRARIPGRWYIGHFDPLFKYSKDDIVQHGGAHWIALRENEDAPGASGAWQLFETNSPEQML